MVAQTTTVSAVNGTKVNGKQAKSKNQLRREKAKQKKTQQPIQPVRTCFGDTCLVLKSK
jgi:hypothetical protein